MTLSAADFLATIREDERETMTEQHDGKLILGGKAIDFDAAPFTKAEFTDRVLAFADQFVLAMIDELQAGGFRAQFSELTDAEKKALYRSIADGFNDETDN